MGLREEDEKGNGGDWTSALHSPGCNVKSRNDPGYPGHPPSDLAAIRQCFSEYFHSWVDQQLQRPSGNLGGDGSKGVLPSFLANSF